MGKASSLFNGVGDQNLHKRLTPSLEQREFLQGQWNRLAEHLKTRISASTGYAISTWLQGSYKYGTLLSPIHENDEYDVDVGVYFEWENDGSQRPSALQLRTWVQHELLKYQALCSDITKIETPAKERCSRAVYSGQFHIDTPVYHLEKSSDRRRLACLSGDWEESDPKAFYKWFKTAVGSGDREQVRRLVRYLKGWSAISFKDAPAARPSSVLLTVLAVDAFKAIWQPLFSRIEDDDLLIEVVKRIYERLRANSTVSNPIDKRENLNRIGVDAWDTFIIRLWTFRNVALRVEEAVDEATAALAWSEAFSYLMPLPPVQLVEFVDKPGGAVVVKVPDIDVEVLNVDNGGAHQVFRNQVPHLEKAQSLRLRISNPGLIPENATIEWTLRNYGAKSDATGDRGHRTVGIGLFEKEEHVSYSGHHHIDCIVRVYGEVRAMRRVAITVGDSNCPEFLKPEFPQLRSVLKSQKNWI